MVWRTERHKGLCCVGYVGMGGHDVDVSLRWLKWKVLSSLENGRCIDELENEGRLTNLLSISIAPPL